MKIRKSDLKGLLLHIAKDAHRPFLNAIYFNVEDKKAYSTDGFTMATCNITFTEGQESILIDAIVLESAIQSSKVTELTIEEGKIYGKNKLGAIVVSVDIVAINETFPQVDRIFSSFGDVDTTVHLNPDFLIRLAQDAKKRGIRIISLKFKNNDKPVDSPIFGLDGKEIINCVMPIRRIASEM